MTNFGDSFWQFLPNAEEDVIINDAKFFLRYLMVNTKFQHPSICLPITVHSFLILQFRLVQNLAASVKWTVIKLFKNGTARVIIVQNDTSYWKLFVILSGKSRN